MKIREAEPYEIAMAKHLMDVDITRMGLPDEGGYMLIPIELDADASEEEVSAYWLNWGERRQGLRNG